MLRKLAIAIAASGALMSATSVHALGMGDIELDSALNQPLDAHIKLLKAGELEDWEIKPDLASTDEFQKSGIERVFFLNNVKFEIERSDEGVFIKLSTQEAVVEPFLNFLVQVDWPNGRLLREYTLLLDPPVFAPERNAPVQAAQTEEFEEEPEMDDDLPGTGVSQQSPMEEETDSFMDDDPVQSEEPQDEYSEDLAEPEPEQETYEVRSNDTLWEVALKTRPNRSISPQQSMLAIQDLNPDSFINGNINRLKKNQVLRIPSEEQINARDFREAVSEVALQNKVIKKRKAQLDATRKVEALDRDEEVTGAELTLLTDGEASSETQRSASGEVMESTAGDQSTLDNELSLALENLDKSQRDNKELSNRLDALEEQINTLQRIINLKDEQMVALQAGFSQQDIPLDADAAVIGQSDQQVPVEEAAVTSNDVGLEADVASPVVVDGTEQPADLNFAAPEEQLAKEEKPKPKAAPVIASEPIEEEFNVVALVMDNIAIFGGALGALLLALLLVNRSRKNKDEEGQVDAAEMSAFEGADPLEQMTEGLESNLDDEFADLEMGGDIDELAEEEGDLAADVSGLESDSAKESENADVLGEAEIYIAYDRMDQARSLLEKTIEDQPGRMDVRVKLLEVLSAIGDSESFTEQYDYVVSQGSEEDQGKANSYRESLGLDGESSEAGLLNELDDELSLSEDLGLDDTSENQGSADLDFEGIELGSDEGDLNFDLDGLGLEDSDNSELDADLSDFDTSLDTDLALDGQDDDLSLEFGSLDLSERDAGDIDSADLNASLKPESGDLDGGLDFDMPELSDDVAAADLTPALDSFSQDDELGDLSLDLDNESEALDSGLLQNDDMTNLDEMSLDLESANELGELSSDEGALEVEGLDLDLDAGMEGFALDIDEDVAEVGSQANTLDDDLSELENSLEAPELESDLDLSLDSDLELSGLESLDSSDNLSLTDSELDLDLGIDESELPSIDGLDGDLLDDLDQLSVDLDVNDLADDVPIIKEQVAGAAQKSTFDLPSLEDNDLDLTDLDGDLDFLSGTDESETKLDLARAYIDMDDQDGAREILQEVLEDGTEQQKQDAGRLMDSLA